jgi:hypothetical protein
LKEGFENPPQSARPQAWWHWINDNVTEEGITADLEWMHRVGIGGMHMFDGDLDVPVFVDKPLIWMTPEWKSALRHAAAEAGRLHMEMSMAASGGWSEAGGPWVKPSQGMKKYVWSETVVEGPRHFTDVLRKPPATAGKFQDLMLSQRPPQPLREKSYLDLTLPGVKPQPFVAKPDPRPEFYVDAAVVAFPASVEDAVTAAQKPAITCSCGPIDGSVLQDGSFAKAVKVSYSKVDGTAWVQFAYSRPQPVQSVLIAGEYKRLSRSPIPAGRIEASDDGQQWRTLIELPGMQDTGSAGFPVRTYSIVPTEARFFRVFLQAPKADRSDASQADVPISPPVGLTEVEFLAAPRINHWEDKASFGIHAPTADSQGIEVQAGEAIDPAGVIDLTEKMRTDGTLDWDVPAGRWVVMRLGYSLSGKVNEPATPAATGLEVDKLSKKDVQAYVEEYVKMISSTAGPYWGKSFTSFVMDSWEAGLENWTEEMQEEFKARRGYAMIKYLPVLTGRVVGSRAESEAFLWDLRRTQADMLAENYYGGVARYLKARGVGLYAEATGAGMSITEDGLLNKGQLTVPMGEFWVPMPGQKIWSSVYEADDREASSAAHIYGKPLAATESFTTMPDLVAWGQGPFYLKGLADQAFSRGINRIIFHTSDQQPFVDDAHKPGMTLGFYGQHYSRNITWAEQAVAWNSYLARCSYLLQQGKPVSDVAYFYGEDAPATVPFWKRIDPAQPAHFDFDYVNSDVLLHGATATPGRLRLASGIRYRLLVLPNDQRLISVPLLKRIHALVQEGAVLLGPRPEGSPSLADGSSAVEEVTKLADDLWGRGDEATAGHAFGKGEVYTRRSIEDVLGALGVPQDFSWSEPEDVGPEVPYSLPVGDSDLDLVFIHRHDGEREIYFAATQKHHAFDTSVSFRVTGKTPRLWRPESGETESVSYTTKSGRTVVPLHFDAQGSVFIVFEGSNAPPSRTVPKPTRTQLASVDGAWKLVFPPDLGAPATAEFPALASWTTSSDPGVKFFSGTSTYRKQFDVPKEWLRSGTRVLLDLGTVKEIAEVAVNGKSVGGIQWKPPFVVDVTGALKPGSNELSVKITNLWPNRMIGDLQPGVTKTYTWTDFRPFKADSPLLESGLLGPVTVWRSEADSQSR